LITVIPLTKYCCL